MRLAHHGFTMKEVAEGLRRQGVPEERVQEELVAIAREHVREARFRLALAGFIIFIILGIIGYIFFFAPGGEVTGRVIGTNSATAAKISSVITRLGVSELRSNKFTNDVPEAEIYFKDTQRTFSAIVNNGRVIVREREAASPDFTVVVDEAALDFLLTAGSGAEFRRRAEQLVREYRQRGYSYELKTTIQDMLLKGYGKVYTRNREIFDAAGVTGGVVAELSLAASGMAGIFVLVLVVWAALLVRMKIGR